MSRLAFLPNAITVLRILLVFPTGWLLWQMRYPEALIVMAVAGLSDALDGFLARRYGWTSSFGAAMDPLADKLLVIVLFVIFTIQGHIPLWVAAIVVGRDVVIMLGALTYRVFFAPIEFAPTFVSKANTAMQIILLILLLVQLVGFEPARTLAEAVIDPYCFWILAVLGIASGVDYIVTWTLKAWRFDRNGVTGG